MSDVFDKKKRSDIMSRIRSTGTKAEEIVFKWLKQHKHKFISYAKGLPGKPDVVLKKYNTIVFIHGCFWHHHKNCSRATTPKTKKRYWISKIESNVKRDKRNSSLLRRIGWHVFTVWECQVNKNIDKAMMRIETHLKKQKINPILPH